MFMSFAIWWKSSASVVFSLDGGNNETSAAIRGCFPNTRAYGDSDVEHAAVVRTLSMAPWSIRSQSVWFLFTYAVNVSAKPAWLLSTLEFVCG